MSNTYLGRVDDFVGEALGHSLEGSESGLTSSLAHQVDGLVDSSERGDIDGLTSNNTTGSNSGRVFTGTTFRDGGDENLDGVVACEEMDEFHSLLDDSDGELLFTVVSSTGSHDHVGESLNNRALSLLESSLLVAASSVRHEHLLSHSLDLEILGEGHIGALNALIGPFSKKLGLKSELALFGLINNNRVFVGEFLGYRNRSVSIKMILKLCRVAKFRGFTYLSCSYIK